MSHVANALAKRWMETTITKNTTSGATAFNAFMNRNLPHNPERT
jgi:hypothetical protein